MRTVALTRVVSGHNDTTIKIDPSHGFAVGVCFTEDGAALDRCVVYTPAVTFTARGTVDEVSAALESATAPPVAAAVEVAPTDLERAAQVLKLFARDHIVWESIDLALGLDPEVGWDDTRDALITLAAKLRGGG